MKQEIVNPVMPGKKTKSIHRVTGTLNLLKPKFIKKESHE